MLALRLARIATRPARRCQTTATANHAKVASESSSSSSTPSVTSTSITPGGGSERRDLSGIGRIKGTKVYW
jgi:hypothetical protein